MASSVTLLKSSEKAYGTVEHKVLYVYAISPRVQDALSNDIVIQTRQNLPPEALPYLSATDLNDLDVGDLGFEILLQRQTAGETNGNLVARILADHAARGALWIAERRAEYAQAGTGVS